MSREELIAHALRWEDKELEARKSLWILSTTQNGDEYLLIVEAVSGPGAVGVAGVWDLLPDMYSTELTLHGPHARDSWPDRYWYRWLSEADVAEMEAELGG